MDAKQFLAEFRHIANAPGGVQRLREMILQLAISGRLVEVLSSENVVDSQLAEAELKKKEYAAEYRIRQSKASRGSISNLFPIPNHWRWAELDRIALYVQRGKGPKYTEYSDNVVISQKCVQWGGLDVAPARYIREDSLESYGGERFLKPNDLLWNSTGTGTVGRVCLVGQPDATEGRIVVDSHVTVIRLANFDARYVWCVIASPWVQQKMSPGHPESLVSGTTQQVELNTSTVRSLLIPCPPKDEQASIVAKVDELMALCDRLEKQQQEKRQLQNQLRQSILQAVAAATSPLELKQHWQRLHDNFEQLFSEPEDVKELRLLINSLGLMGMLTERLPTDNLPAKLIYESEHRMPAITEGDFCRIIPNEWRWIRTPLLGESRLGKMLDKAKNRGSLVPYLRNVNVRWREFNLSDVLEMRIEDHEAEKVSVVKNDLVICEGGEPGRAAVWRGGKSFVIQKALHRFRCNEHLLPEYFLLCLEHDYFSGRLRNFYTGATIKHLTGKALARYSIPIPSVSEQIRILSRVDEFKKIADMLEAKLRTSRTLGDNLAIASIAALTGINAPQEEEPLKIPKTELIAPVALGPSKPSSKDSAPLAALLARQQGKMSANDLWQRFGGEIDDFYAQLKHEVAHGWVEDPSYVIARNDEERKNNIQNPKLYPNGSMVARVVEKDSAI